MTEAQYIRATPLSHRKSYGQFFTPPPVARLMARWVLKDHPRTILDPAFGLGVFYDEVEAMRPGERDFLFTGCEVDPHILSCLDRSGPGQAHLRLLHQDYLEAGLQGYDAILCNPPYLRFQKFINRRAVLPKIEAMIGKKLVGYANTASVFLVKSLHELNPNGRLAYILPFEFFNTRYGQQIKKSLLEEHLLKQIVIFENEKEIFPGVITTVCILLCRKDRRSEGIKITRIAQGADLDRIPALEDFYQQRVEPSALPYTQKWTPILESLFSGWVTPEGFCKVSAYGAFKRGIATGANEFFALTRAETAALELGENVRQCITKSAQVRKAVFTQEDFERLSESDKPVYCLDVHEPPDPPVLRYLRTGEQRGFHHRYLTRHRTPWYRIEVRDPAPILFGVFTRGRLKVVRNYSRAINFTCFHSFYPNGSGQAVLDKLFVFFLSDLGQRVVRMNQRSYGDNLDKLEPGDLNECLCPNPEQFARLGAGEAAQVIELARTDIDRAIELSNKIIRRMTTD